MRLVFCSILLEFSVWMPETHALVVPSSPALFPGDNGINTTASTDNSCTYLKQNLTADCWDELDMSGYLDQWWQQNEPTCSARGIGFAACYQQLAGMEQQQCSHTGPSMCDFPDNISLYTPHEAYALYSIFAIWQWFESIYEAIGNADVSAQGPVGVIEQAINPVAPSTQTLGSFFQALTAMTPLIGVPAKVGEMAIKQTARNIETALRQSPGVFKQLNPSGTLNSEFDQVNNIYDGLARIKNYYQANVSTALSLVQNNMTTFSLFSAHGSFIAPRMDLQAQTTNLTMALTTNIIATALSQTNIVLTLARETDPNALAHNGSLGDPSLDLCAGYDAHGMCDQWWYDASTNAAYSLSKIDEPDRSYASVLQSFFAAGYTTGEALFLGAKACADWQAVVGGIGNSAPAIDPVLWQQRCVSNTQVCVWDQSCEFNDVDCAYTGEFGWGSEGQCGPPKEYLQSACGVGEDIPSTKVPMGYLGPMVRNESPTFIVCR